MPGNQSPLMIMVTDYFSNHPGVELDALEVLQRARLSTRIGKPVNMTDLRNALDRSVELDWLKVRISGAVRRYSWAG